MVNFMVVMCICIYKTARIKFNSNFISFEQNRRNSITFEGDGVLLLYVICNRYCVIGNGNCEWHCERLLVKYVAVFMLH